MTKDEYQEMCEIVDYYRPQIMDYLTEDQFRSGIGVDRFFLENYRTRDGIRLYDLYRDNLVKDNTVVVAAFCDPLFWWQFKLDALDGWNAYDGTATDDPNFKIWNQWQEYCVKFLLPQKNYPYDPNSDDDFENILFLNALDDTQTEDHARKSLCVERMTLFCCNGIESYDVLENALYAFQAAPVKKSVSEWLSKYQDRFPDMSRYLSKQSNYLNAVANLPAELEDMFCEDDASMCLRGESYAKELIKDAD